MKSLVLCIVGIVSILIVVTSCSGEIDADKLYEAIADSFSPKIDIPFTQLSYMRIDEIKPLDPATGDGGTRFLYETDSYARGANIRFIWNAPACENSFTYLKWGMENTPRWDMANTPREAFIGNATPEFDPAQPEQLEAFLSEADTWVFSYDTYGQLVKVYLKDDPGSYRRFTYNHTRDFYDSIIDYTQGRIHKILKYQYGEGGWDLLGVLELNQAGDTTGVYTYEPVPGDHQEFRFRNSLFGNRLIGIPNAPCSYLFLHGPLWAWHFPIPVSKLFKDGELVFEAFYEYGTTPVDQYESNPAFPRMAHYSRVDEDGIMTHYSEEIVSEVILQE